MLLDRAAEGLKTPALDRRPILLPGLDIFLTAYRELEFDKPVGMAVGPIPWSSIDRWGTRHGFDDADDLAELVAYIRAIEKAVHERENGTAKAEPDDEQPIPKKKGAPR